MPSFYSPGSTDSLFSLPNTETKPRKRKRKNLSTTSKRKVEDKKREGRLKVNNFIGHRNLLCDLDLEPSSLKLFHNDDTSRKNTSEAAPRSALKNGKYRTIISYRKKYIQIKRSNDISPPIANGKNEQKNYFDSLGNINKPTNIPIASLRNESPKKCRKQMIGVQISSSNGKEKVPKPHKSPCQLASTGFGKEAQNSLVSIPSPKLIISSAKSHKSLTVTPKKSKSISMKKKSNNKKGLPTLKRKATLNSPEAVTIETSKTKNTSVTNTSAISKKPSRVILAFWNAHTQKDEDQNVKTNKTSGTKNIMESSLRSHKNNNVHSEYLNNSEKVEPVVKNVESKHLSITMTSDEHTQKTENMSKEITVKDSLTVSSLDKKVYESDNLLVSNNRDSQQFYTGDTNIDHSGEFKTIVKEPIPKLGICNEKVEGNSAFQTSISSKSDRNFDKSCSYALQKSNKKPNQLVHDNHDTVKNLESILNNKRLENECTDLNTPTQSSSNKTFIDSNDQSLSNIDKVQINNLEPERIDLVNNNNYATYCHTPEIVKNNENTQVSVKIEKNNDVVNLAPFETPISFANEEKKHLLYSKRSNSNSDKYDSVKVNVDDKDEDITLHFIKHEPNALVFVKERLKPYAPGGIGRIVESKNELSENTYKVNYVLGGWEAKVHASRIQKVSDKTLQQKFTYETRTQSHVTNKLQNEKENDAKMEDNCETKTSGDDQVSNAFFERNKNDAQSTVQKINFTDSYHNADALFTALHKAHIDEKEASYQIQQQEKSEVLPLSSLLPNLDRTPSMKSFFTPRYGFVDKKNADHPNGLSVEKLKDIFSIISQENTPLHLPMAKTRFERVEFPILQHAQCKRSEFDIISLQRNDIFQRMQQLYFEIKSSLKKISHIENNKINIEKINRQVSNKQKVDCKEKHVSSLENINTPLAKEPKVKRRSRSASGRKQLKPVERNQRKCGKASKNKHQIGNCLSSDESSYADSESLGKEDFDSNNNRERYATKKHKNIKTNTSIGKNEKKTQFSSSNTSNIFLTKNKIRKIKDHINDVTDETTIRKAEDSFSDKSRNSQLSQADTKQYRCYIPDFQYNSTPLNKSASPKYSSASNSSIERIRKQKNKEVPQPRLRSYSSLSDASMSSYDSSQRIIEQTFLRRSNSKRRQLNPRRHMKYLSKEKLSQSKFKFVPGNSLKKNQSRRRHDEEEVHVNGHPDYKSAKEGSRSKKLLHATKHDFLSPGPSLHSYSIHPTYPLYPDNEHNGRIVRVQNSKLHKEGLKRSKISRKRSTSMDKVQRQRKQIRSSSYNSGYFKSIGRSKRKVSQSLHSHKSHKRQSRSCSQRRSISPSNARSILEEI